MNFKSDDSMTDKIFGLLHGEIAEGRLHPGEKIESTRELAVKFNVSKQVIISTFKRLASEGLVVTFPRSGAFVAEKLPSSLIRKKLSIGYLNWKTTLSEAFPLRIYRILIRQAKKRDIRIHLNSMESEMPLLEWEREYKLDAIIVSGRVDDALIRKLREVGVPFLVLGNYRLTENANQLESDLVGNVRNTVTELMKKYAFHRIGAIVCSGLVGSQETVSALQSVLAAYHRECDSSLFFETDKNDGFEAAKFLIGEKKMGAEDMILLNPDMFTGCAKYIFEQGIKRKNLPFLLMDMPASESIPYRELIGAFLYGPNEPLVEYALDSMLDIYYGKVSQPWHGIISNRSFKHISHFSIKSNLSDVLLEKRGDVTKI